MNHEVELVSLANGDARARCECGWATDWAESHLVEEKADQHQQDAKRLLLNKGPKPSLKTLARYYREQSESKVFTAEQRAQWLMLAEEIEAEIATQAVTVLEGQIELF